MLIIPAIDLKDGHCVRLEQGAWIGHRVLRRSPARPRAVGRKGARRLHVVDLNGAVAGKPRNEAAVKAIIAASTPTSRCSWAAASATWTPSSATSTTACPT
jgi:phosphoribosylformimino-5-aminoimidazole carboxamide ribotide isomerase